MTKSQRLYNQWLKWSRSYERAAYKVFNPVFRAYGRNIDFNAMTEQNYESLVQQSIDSELMLDAYVEVYGKVGMKHAKRVGRSVNAQSKNFVLGTFETFFGRQLPSMIQDLILMNRITTVDQTWYDTIIATINKGLAEEKGIRGIARELQEQLSHRNYYRWETERIARTEVTAAANWSASLVADSDIYVMQKVWLSGTDPRVRPTHRTVNNKRVPYNGLFQVGNDFLRYAGDPKGSAKEVINCRCTIVVTPKKDNDGNLIFK